MFIELSPQQLPLLDILRLLRQRRKVEAGAQLFVTEQLKAASAVLTQVGRCARACTPLQPHTCWTEHPCAPLSEPGLLYPPSRCLPASSWYQLCSVLSPKHAVFLSMVLHSQFPTAHCAA